MNFYTIIPMIFLVVRCGGIPITPVPDEPDTVEDCDAACDNMERLGCESAEGSPGADEQFGTKDDVSCADVCRNVMSGSYGVPMSPVCVSKVDSCEAVSDCYK